jgi:hypothetical protein
MLKKLRYKLFTLLVLCAALTAVSFPPASFANTGGPFCIDAPLDSGCPVYLCCNEWGSCWCAG